MSDRQKFIEGYLAARVICGRCGCTLATFAAKCSADLADRCPGYETIEAADRRYCSEHNL